jgi:hypothetical protein
MIKSRNPETSEWKVNKGRNKKLTFKPTFDYLLDKYTKADPKDRAVKRPRPLMRQDRREHPKQAKLEAERKGIIEGKRYDLRISQPSQFAHPFGHPGASSSIVFSVNQMQWRPPPDDASISDLGSISPNLGNLSTNDVDDPLGLGGYLTNWFSKGWNSQQAIELIHPPVNKMWSQSIRRSLCLKVRLKGLLPKMSSESVQAK